MSEETNRCHDCKHESKSAHQEPCMECMSDIVGRSTNKWEPKEEGA